MAELTGEPQNDQVLVESSSFDFIHGPIRKTTRLRYKCAAISNSLVALGSNTGGIYLFSRSEEKLLQIAFAEKETSSVVSLQLSPNEKFVAFVSGQGNIYVLELKLGSNAKSETLRSTSELAGTRVTSLHWDTNSTKLYIGDDNGKVSVMPVSSNKAKNLFSQEIEVIMKLDAPIVQIDKAEQHVLVSTTTKVYLCDTNKLNYKQVGKKLRDGPYGACFLCQDSEMSMIYCARPGSRIWEVDCNGSVLNTHQFKRLILGSPLSNVFSTNREFPSLETSRYEGELANFSKLKVLCGIFLLTWGPEVVYILDPINVKVILWINKFTGILDVTCLGNEIYIFQESMEITHLAVMPVSEVVPLCLTAQNICTAARLCIAYKNVLHHKHVRKKLSVVDLYALHDKLLSLDLPELAEELRIMILEVEGKIAIESDSDSNRSRSSSIISNSSVDSKKVQSAHEIHRHLEPSSDQPSNLEHSGEVTSTNVPSIKIDSSKKSEQYENHSGDSTISTKAKDEEALSAQTYENCDTEIPIQNNVVTILITDTTDRLENVHNAEANKCDKGILSENAADGSEQIQKGSSGNSSIILTNSGDSRVVKENGCVDITINKEVEGSEIKSAIDSNATIIHTNGPLNVNTYDFHSSVAVNKDIPDIPDYAPASMETDPDTLTVTIVSEGKSDQEEDGIDSEIRTPSLGSRRPSLTSLSSISSAEVFMDQKQINGSTDGPIAVAVKKKTKKRRARKSVGDQIETQHKEGLDTRRKSTGSFPVFMDRKGMMSPTGSLQEAPIDEGPETNNLLQDSDYFINKGKSSADKTPDSLSIGSPLSNSGEYELSVREMSRSGEFSTSQEPALPDSPLQGSLEKNKTAMSKIKLKKMKDKMQTTVSTKTKNLIRNIKEKNLLTKAKELAENFSQVSENNKFLFGDGPYIDPDNMPKLMPDEIPNDNDGVVEENFDDGIYKPESVVDLEQLKAATEDTMAKLSDVEILLNPEASQVVLEEWITVLNETLYKLHVKKFMPCGPSVIIDSSEKLDIHTQGSANSENKEKNERILGYDTEISENAPEDGQTQGLAKTGNKNEICKDGSKLETSDPANAGYDISSSFAYDQSGEDTLDSRWTYGARILCDKDFGYCKDPLCLPAELYKDVCTLAQVCFDTDTHGNILKYRFRTQCNFEHKTQANSLDNVSTINSGIVATDCDKLKMSPTDACDNDSVDTMKHESENIYTGNGQRIETLDIHRDTESSWNVSKDDMQNSENNEHFHKNKSLSPNSENSDTEERAPKTKDKVDTATDERSTKTSNTLSTHITDDSGAKTNDNEEVFAGKDGPELNPEEQEHTKDSDRIVNSVGSEKEAMAFYVRCYFPYLNLSKVQQKLQTEKDIFELWSAFVSCLQGYVVNDSERLGIQKNTVIDHLIETHYHSDNSTLLLGHISRLFLRWDDSGVSSVVSTCVKCFPFIQPIDVLYLCRLYSLDIDKLFQQYMFSLCEQIAKSHRSDKDALEADIYSHTEVKCAWLEVLLAEEGNQTVVMDTKNKPRKGSHKLRWRNEYYLQKIVSSELSKNDCHRILQICYKFGFWCGVLRLTKKLGLHEEHLHTILYLGDMDLISAEHELGYLPTTNSDWEYLILQFLAHTSADREPSEVDRESSKVVDWVHDKETSLTLENLCQIMLRYIGPEQTLAMLDKLVPERKMPAEFYQSCLLSSLVKKQQRSILHTMLEAVDSYLWSQRPNELSPQLNMCLRQGKDGQIDMDANSEVMKQLMDAGSGQLFIEDSDCHWGVEARNKLRCCSCNNLLKATVSLDQSGVLIFRCGHGYHVVCLPEEQCLICLDQD